jgi:hypothetical protein
MTPDQKAILTQALTLDVKFQKNVAQIVAHIHNNPTPDFEWMNTTIRDAEKWVCEWEAIHERVAEAGFYFSSEVAAYFVVSLDLTLHFIQGIPRRVQERLDEGKIPSFKDERMIPMFTYSPALYMNEATQKLASMIEVDLS